MLKLAPVKINDPIINNTSATRRLIAWISLSFGKRPIGLPPLCKYFTYFPILLRFKKREHMSKLLKNKLFYKKIVSTLQQGKEYVFFQLEKDCSKGLLTWQQPLSYNWLYYDVIQSWKKSQ